MAARFHVVLLEPEIPWNTGNVGRSCVAAGASLHLVGKLGFALSERRIRRAGMDYWSRLELHRHADWAQFERSVAPGARLFGFSASAPKTFWEAPLAQGGYLIFGRESTGLAPAVLERLKGDLYRIPMRPEARSLNLSTAAALALYEGLRAAGGATNA